MTSWTAWIDWHEDPTARDVAREWMAVLEPDVESVRWDGTTGTMTVVVTLERRLMAQALWAALDLVGGVTGKEVSLRRIAATHTHERSIANGEPDRPAALASARALGS